MVKRLIEAIFTKVPPMYLIIGSTFIALFMGTLAAIIRSKAVKRPASIKTIILPPLFMSTGAFMFIFEEFRVAPLQIVEAISYWIAIFNYFNTHDEF